MLKRILITVMMMLTATNAHAWEWSFSEWNRPFYRSYIIVKYQQGFPPEPLHEHIFYRRELCETSALLLSSRSWNRVNFICEKRK